MNDLRIPSAHFDGTEYPAVQESLGFSPRAVYPSTMLFPCTQRHYAICALRDLSGIFRRDPDFWNVISVLEPSVPPIQKQGFLKIHRMVCEDEMDRIAVAGADKELPQSLQLRAVFDFSDQVIGEPLLFHCMFGSSRSPAIALLLMMRDMRLDGFSVVECAKESLDFLMQIRPNAQPNRWILEQGLSLLFAPAELPAAIDVFQTHMARPER